MASEGFSRGLWRDSFLREKLAGNDPVERIRSNCPLEAEDGKTMRGGHLLSFSILISGGKDAK